MPPSRWRKTARLHLLRLLVRVAQQLMTELTEAQKIRQDLLSIDIEDLEERPYFAPRWGPIDAVTGKRTGRWFVVRELTGADRALVMDEMVARNPKTGEAKTNLKALYGIAVVLGLHAAIPAPGDDPEHPQHPELMRAGEKIFGITDRDAVIRRSGATLEEIGQIVMKMSGLEQDQLEAAKKNSIPATATPTIVESTASTLISPNGSARSTRIS